MSLPPESNPSFNFEGASCGAGQFGPVFFIPGNFTPESGTIDCVVPAGTATYVGVGGAECSSVEPPPFFGRNEDELRTCAITMNDAVTAIEASVNGQEVPDILDYRATSPLFTLNGLSTLNCPVAGRAEQASLRCRSHAKAVEQ